MMMPDMMRMLSQLKANPAQFLMQRNLNLPQGVAATDPQAILNHLLKTRQVSQQQINAAYQMAQSFHR